MRVWRHPAALRVPPTDPPLQIAADCGLEWDAPTNNRNSIKVETDFTKNGKLSEGRSKSSYKMLIQKLAELNTLGESGGDLRKVYRSTLEAEQVWKKNTVNQQLEPTVASTGSVQTSGPQRDVHFHSSLPPRASALHNARWPGIEGCRGEGEPIDPFQCRPIPVRRGDRRFFLPLWILKPTNNKPSVLLPGGQCTARRSCVGLGQEPSEAEEMSSGQKMEEEGSGYPYPDFLPPPFNRVDFGELSLLEEHQWKEALPARPNSPLGQLIGRIVQLEKTQLLTIQREKGRQPDTAPGSSPKASSSSTRKKAKRSRKCRRGDLVCLQQQQPYSEACLKKANPAKMGHHKHSYRVSSGQSCNDPHDLHSSSEDLKHRRHRRANWSSYLPYKRSVPEQVILSRNDSAFVNNQPFSAVEAGQTLAVHNKPANIIHYKHKKKQV
ncbi:protein FAM217A [Amblyraja radiata]|uniref:protein FAM217A n=1 Tax=Amblyraja radiata TaxID=386614 RepID=UPI0014024400|nr:protein FAM217A [Amblyraja radiata]